MAQKIQKGLGRGINALIPDYVPQAPAESGPVRLIPLQKAEPNPGRSLIRRNWKIWPSPFGKTA